VLSHILFHSTTQKGRTNETDPQSLYNVQQNWALMNEQRKPQAHPRSGTKDVKENNKKKAHEKKDQTKTKKKVI